jgi:hypothetical protein
VFHIIAYPNGRRAIVGTVYHDGRKVDHDYVARVSGVTPPSPAEGIVAHAAAQARVRGEYVDVEHDGRCIAVVDPWGAVVAS